MSSLLLIAITPVTTGCGGDLYQRLSYKDAVFTDQPSKGYPLMLTGENDLGGHFSLADVYVRFPDGAVFALQTLPEKEAKNRALGAKPEVVKDFKTYSLTPHAYSRLYYRGERLVGASLGFETEIAKLEKGPFYKFPLSEAQIRELFGEP